jgi:hypothetical protein
MSPVLLLLLALATQSPESEEMETEPGPPPPPPRVAAPITVGGEGFTAALARANRYEGHDAADTYRSNLFMPAVRDALEDVLAVCVRDLTPAPQPFTVVISFNAQGDADGVFVDRASPAAQCAARNLSLLSAPVPPVPDFAEEIHFRP